MLKETENPPLSFETRPLGLMKSITITSMKGSFKGSQHESCLEIGFFLIYFNIEKILIIFSNTYIQNTNE